jgi:arginine repressor
LAPNLIVINTLPGHTNSVAYVIDEESVADEYFGISGTIAGDDTIFIAVDDKQLSAAYKQLKDLFLKP